jgi:hypothetical protein
MPTLTRANHHTSPRCQTTGTASHTAGSAESRTPEVRTGIDRILSMRVGCWRPPVYVDLTS